jgi:hypothetical protein
MRKPVKLVKMDTVLYVNNVGKQLDMVIKSSIERHTRYLEDLVLIDHLSKLVSDLNPFNVTMSECDRIKIKGFISDLKKELPFYHTNNNTKS